MVTILLSLVAFAQPPQPPRFNPEKFEADMEQFITTDVGLTPMEASRFFPLFREMQNKQRALFGKMRFYAHTDTSDDAASLKAIKECDKIELEMKKIRQEYHLKFCKVLSPVRFSPSSRPRRSSIARRLKGWQEKDGKKENKIKQNSETKASLLCTSSCCMKCTPLMLDGAVNDLPQPRSFCVAAAI